jgi:TfoX/Sxy family transcriptional regulator of competence genes
MPSWSRPPEALVTRFARATRRLTGVETRTLFGYPAVFAAGRMFAGLFRDRMILRLPDAERARFSLVYGARPFEPSRGRVLREYVEVPPEVLVDPRLLAASLVKARDYVAGLPPTPPRRATRASAGRKPARR